MDYNMSIPQAYKLQLSKEGLLFFTKKMSQSLGAPPFSPYISAPDARTMTVCQSSRNTLPIAKEYTGSTRPARSLRETPLISQPGWKRPWVKGRMVAALPGCSRMVATLTGCWRSRRQGCTSSGDVSPCFSATENRRMISDQCIFLFSSETPIVLLVIVSRM